MSEARAGVILEAEDRASEKIKQVQGSLAGLQGAVERMQPAFKTMAVAGTAAFGIISGIGITSLNAFADAEKQMTVANKALENSLGELSKGAMTDLQNKIGKGKDVLTSLKETMGEVGKSAVKLGFDDEKASTAFAKFFQISKNVDQAQRDVKLAMDLSAFSGKDLESTQKAITLAYAGGARVLKDFGIQLEDGATKQDVFNAIQQKAGGTAEEVAKTTAGQIAIMQIQFGNLQESIGGALAPALTKVMQILQPLLDKFVAWAEANPDLVAKIILVAGAIAGLVAVLGTVGIILPTIIAGISALATAGTFLAGVIGAITLPMLGIIVVIGLLIAAGIYLYTHWDEVKAKATEVWNGIMNTINGIVTKIQNSISAFWDWVKTTLSNVTAPITNMWNALWNGLTGTVSSVWTTVKNTIVDSVNFIINKVNSVINAINAVASAGAGMIGVRAPTFPTIPMLAEGGIVNRPTLAMIGEAGAEAVIPLSKMNGMGNGQTIVVNINGGNYLDRDAGLMLGDHIISALQQQMRI